MKPDFIGDFYCEFKKVLTKLVERVKLKVEQIKPLRERRYANTENI